MRLLRIPPPLHDEGDMIHVNGFACIGPLDDRQEVVADLGPHVEERSAERGRVLAGEDLGVGVVVEQRPFRSPGDGIG